jgi:hypothetical protein
MTTTLNLWNSVNLGTKEIATAVARPMTTRFVTTSRNYWSEDVNNDLHKETTEHKRMNMERKTLCVKTLTLHAKNAWTVPPIIPWKVERNHEYRIAGAYLTYSECWI